MKSNIFLSLLICASCASSSPPSERLVSHSRVFEIPIGSTEERLKREFGGPARTNYEKLSGQNFVVWEYGPEIRPMAFFTIDPKTHQIVGKSIWIYESDPTSDLSGLLKREFSVNHFEKYTPCHERGEEQVLVDRKDGIFIASRDQRANLISWTDQRLAELRVNQFYLNCPQLQVPKKKDD